MLKYVYVKSTAHRLTAASRENRKMIEKAPRFLIRALGLSFLGWF
jgi:hypothetical protein